jgi:hypothetical protein
MIYINPSKAFCSEGFNVGWEQETEILVKVQIDNSLALGWKKEDIWLVTNFGYEYKGIKAIDIGDDVWCEHSPTASKLLAIIRMFELGMIQDELYWFHDFDAFQLAEITEDEVGIGDHEIGITDYGVSSVNPGRSLRWSTGTIFFRKGSADLFSLWKNETYKYKANEEIALLEMLKKGRYRKIRARVKKLNITYNLATRCRLVSETYEIADKPLKVIHFHPFDKRPVEDGNDNMAVCVYGKNYLNKVLVTPRLIEAFDEHGIS